MTLKYIFFLITLTALPLFFSSIEGIATERGAEFQSFKSTCDMMLSILETAADKDYIGEAISQKSHALQCAYLALLSGADDEVVLAALLHDIGHQCAEGDITAKWNEYGVMNHDLIGAQYLHQCGMSDRVCELVLGHVQAKRYLTFVDQDYADRLTEASKRTLIEQGGPMDAAEAAAFENDPLFDEKIKMRDWDEQGKVVDLEVPALITYRKMLLKHIVLNKMKNSEHGKMSP